MKDINLWFGCKNLDEIQAVVKRILGITMTLNTNDDWQLVHVGNTFEIGYDPEEGLRLRPYERFDLQGFCNLIKRVAAVESIRIESPTDVRITLVKGFFHGR